MKKKILFCLLLFSATFSLVAQDTEFWFTPNSEFGPDCNPNVPPSWGNLHLLDDGGFIFTNGTNQNAIVNIHFFKTNLDIPVTVPANGFYHYRMDSTFVRTNLQTTYSEAGLQLPAGAYITSDVEVLVYYFHDSQANQAMYNLKGAEALGKDFYVTQSSDGYYWNGGAPPQYIDARDMVDIMATENATIITITPTRDIWVGGRGVTIHPAGTPLNITLNKGETFKIMETTAGTWNSYAPGIPNTLSGTHIVSTNLIAVTSGEDVSNYDMIGDQLVPIGKGRTLFTVIKGYSSGSGSTDRAYLVSTTPGTTTVTVDDGGTLTTLTMSGIGDTVVYNMGNTDTDNPTLEAVTIRGNQPFLCYHVTAMQVHPGGGLVPSLYTLSGNRFSFFQMGWPNTSGFLGVDNAMNLVYRTDYDTAFVINYNNSEYKLFTSHGVVHPSLSLKGQGTLPQFPGWSYARIILPTAADSSVVTLYNENSPFSLGYFSGGLSFSQPYCTYGYLTGFKPFQFNPDTVWRCAGNGQPVTLVGGFAEYYKWILPDGTVKEGADMTSLVTHLEGRYILKMNQGQGSNEADWTTDTCWVTDVRFNASISKVPKLPKPAKVGVPQVFNLNMSPSLLSKATISWTFEGGTPSGSNVASPTVVWNSTGIKRVTLNLSVLTCDTTIIMDLLIRPRNNGYFVDQNVNGGLHDGSNWQNAFVTIQEALELASQGDYIWVAKGEYSPFTDDTYLIDYDSVCVYGGFGAWEANLNERDFAANPTILNGKNNSVVTFDGSTSYSNGLCGIGTGAVLDGFIIQNGKAANGAGILFRNGASGTISNCIIRGNYATQNGGGLHLVAPGCGHDSPVFFNLEVSGNTAVNGAGIYNSGSDFITTNITVSGNKATSTGGLYSNGGNPDIRNTIIWGNRDNSSTERAMDLTVSGGTPAYTYSIIGGSNGSGSAWNVAMGTDAGKNKDVSPLFRRSGFDDFGAMRQGNYQLTATSKAVNTGRNNFVLSGNRLLKEINLLTPTDTIFVSDIPNDLNGANRIEYDIVDRGAYEYYKDNNNAETVHQIFIPVVDNITTDPETGLYWVGGHDSYVLILYPKEGYSLKDIKITTGSKWQDEQGAMLVVHNEDGSVTVTFREVTEPINVQISGVDPVSNEMIDSSYAIWTNNNRLHVRTTKAGILKVYTLTGTMLKQQELSEGEISFPLLQGVYIVTFNDGYQQKVVVK